MSQSTSSTLDAIFKRQYNEGSEVLVTQQNLSAKFFSKIKKSSIKPSAQGIFMPVLMSGNESGGAQNESQAFNSVQSANPQSPQILSKLTVWPFRLTGKSILESESNKQAFMSSVDAQMKDNMLRINSDINRQSLGTGTGQLTLANGAGAPATALVVDNALPFRRGQKIDAYASLGGAKEIDGIEVTAVAYGTNTVTLGTSSTWSDNAIIVKQGVADGVTSATNGKELSGLQAIADTTSFGTSFEGLPVSTNPEWQAQVIAAGANPISQDLLQRLRNQVALVGGVNPNKLASNYGQARTFINSELNKVRYEPGKVEGGAIVLKWMDMEWIVEKDCPTETVFMYDDNYLELFSVKGVHLADDDGKVLYKVDGYDMIGGYYRFVGNTGTWKRNAFGKMTGLTEPNF